MRAKLVLFRNLGVLLVLLLGSFILGYRETSIHVLERDDPATRSTWAADALPASIVTREPVTDSHDLELKIAARDETLLLLFLKSDCPFCAQNMPNWRRLVASARAQNSDLTVLALSLSSMSATLSYMQQYDLRAPVRLVDRQYAAEMGLAAVPATVLIPPRATNVYSWTGVLSLEDLDDIETLLTHSAEQE